MRSRIRLMLAALLTIASVERSLAQAPTSGPAPGVLLDVGGHRLHLRCVGPTGTGPTVILEAGGGAFSRTWSAVQELLASEVRTCAYDRAGLGWSEPGPEPRTLRQEVFELHALLEAGRVSRPYVLVGQSIGGLLVRLYAERYPDDVAGMVLVDPTHESAMLGSLRYGGWVRLREKATGRPIPEPRRAGSANVRADPEVDYLAEELQQIYLARKANPVPLGSLPLIVLSAGRRGPPPGTSEELWEQLRIENDGQKVELSRLSTNSRFVLDPQSRHNIELDNPQIVARSIGEVLAAVAARGRLLP